MHRPARLDSVYVIAAVVMAAAALFEAGYGGPEAELTPLSVALRAAHRPGRAGRALDPAGRDRAAGGGGRVPMLFVPDLPPSGGAQLIVWMLLVGIAAYRLSRDRGLIGVRASRRRPRR